jgi:Carboxypeptidase regulatory-like domain
MKSSALIIVSAMFVYAPVGFAQEDKAVLTGIITDTSEAVIPGAIIEVASAVNGFLRKAESNHAGSYTIGGLPVGVYDITVRKDGFQGARFNSVKLVVGQIRTVNAQSTVAANASEVTVYAVAAALAKSSPDVGGVVVNLQMGTLPINGRNWTALLALVPGAIDSGGANQQTVRFAGRGNDDNNFRFDGVDATGIQHQRPRRAICYAIAIRSSGRTL